MSGSGHPLPASEEARHNEIPEHLVEEKGEGDDAKVRVQPEADPVAPDGTPYRYDDPARGLDSKKEELEDKDTLRADQAAHQDRGQSDAEIEVEDR